MRDEFGTEPAPCPGPICEFVLQRDEWTLRFEPEEDPSLVISVLFRDTSRERLAGTDFLVNESLAGWTGSGLLVGLSSPPPRGATAAGEIIPEPPSAALFLIGLGAMGVVVVRRRAARFKTLALMAALMIPFSSAAMPVEPIVFDFEDGLQGWELHGSAERVRTQLLDGEWAIFGDGFVPPPFLVGREYFSGGALMVMRDVELGELASISVDFRFLDGDPRGLGLVPFVQVRDSFLIPLDVRAFTTADPGVNPGVRTVDVRGLQGVRRIAILWAIGCEGGIPCGAPPLMSPGSSVGFIDNITFHPIPEPGSVALLVIGLVGVVLGRAVRG